MPNPTPTQPPCHPAAAGTPTTEHEQLCTRCGKCCYQKIILGTTVVITPFPCQYYDEAAHGCRIYARRKEINPSCLSVPEGLRVSAFPADCAYVARLAPPGYRPAVDEWNWQGQWQDFDELADDLKVPEAIREMVRARGPDAPPPWAAPRGVPPRAGKGSA
jgi:hypothetical protein